MKGAAPSLHQLESFSTQIAVVLGLQFEADKHGMLGEVLLRRAAARRQSVDAYLLDLKAEQGSELRMLAQELTVGETYFFRHGEQMEAFRNEALPRRISAGGKPLRILSAGCSTGEETYSLAILAREAGLAEGEVEILGLELNPNSLAKARSGRYSRWSLRETPEPLRERWFRQSGAESVLDPTIVASVSFQECNLMAANPQIWQPELYDIVFCRNVLMYFTQQQARSVVERISGSIAPGGYLFLGHADTLRGLSEDFELLSSHQCFYYQRTSGKPATVSSISPELSWIEAIQGSSDRIHQLDFSDVAATTPLVLPDLQQVRDLQETERYAEALELLRQLPKDLQELPETLLLQAVLLVQLSEFEQPEQLCGRLLGMPGYGAGAHYVLALCREGRGEIDAAAAEHRASARLDPSFAMPRVHLGLLARRADDFKAARRELESALLLLQGEDPPRLRLYGGGFGREALMSLCRSELAACRSGR